MTDQQFSTSMSTEDSRLMESVMEKFTNAASVDAVYGAPVQQDNIIVVPAAEVLCAMGFGVGSGSGMAENNQGGSGGGGGGGGRVFSRPVAAIIIQDGQVRVEPVVDATKIALGMFTTIGFVFAMVWRMSRRKLKV